MLAILVGQSVSTSTARDGQTLTLNYQIASTIEADVTLRATLIGPNGESISDHYRDKTVHVAAGTQSLSRELLVNLPPGGSIGKYDVVWQVHSTQIGDASVTQADYLTIQSPVSVRVPVVMYHNVAPVAQGEDWVSTSMFRAHMEALKAYGYTPITLSELMDYRAGVGTAPVKPIMLTFDDGYANFYTDVFPVLSAPAFQFKSTLFPIVADMDTQNPDIISWPHLQEVAASGLVDVESHTVNHVDLTRVNSATLQAELVNSKRDLETHLGKEVRLISWPFGAYNSTVQKAAWQAGYAGAVAAWGGVEQTSADKWALKRLSALRTTSVDYDPSQPGEFFFTKIGDSTVPVPRITINSLEYLDSSGNPLPGNQVQPGQTVKVRVTAANAGPAAVVAAGLNLDSDNDRGNGLVYQSHAAGQDVTGSFAAGTQSFEWTWQVPADAATGQYYADATFRDQYSVLGFKDSGWQAAFQVQVSSPIQAPSITTQPQSQTVQQGTPATFSVIATGTAPLSYQWQHNGADITGATSSSYTLSSPTTADSGAQFRVIVSNGGGSATSNTATLTVNADTGLQGQYYDTSAFTNLKFTRTDPTVNFNWGTGSPGAAIANNTFSIRWTGFVQPQYSQTYTFYTVSDDGVRLWVNGTALINNWTNHSATTNSGIIALVAGQKYTIQMDYYENTGRAVAQLLWSSPSVAKQVIPSSRLYLPASSGSQVGLAAGSLFLASNTTKKSQTADDVLAAESKWIRFS